MSVIKVDLLWSPNHADKYVTIGTDMNLYKVETYKHGNFRGQGNRISDTTFATLLSTNSENQYMKCCSWCPHSSPDHLLAVGQANGRVVLTTFGKGGTNDPNNLIGKEFVPRHSRQCNCLAWNPVETNLLAQGLEKYRADYSILIWDVLSKPGVDITATPDRRQLSGSVDYSSVTKPLVELGSSDTAMSICWFNTEPKTLVTGMNNKFLRIFDLRDTTRPQNVAYTKAVYGVNVDPHNEVRLASFVEGQVSVWDTRNFDKPVLTFNDPRHVVKLGWCPTRPGLLACLGKDSKEVNLYDIQHASFGADELEPAVMERIVQPHESAPVSSFAWHPRHENRMLTVTPSGVVRDIQVFERIALSWSSNFHLTWSCGRKLLQCDKKVDAKAGRSQEEDISVQMMRRAIQGYGLQREQVSRSAFLADGDRQIRNLWLWLDYVKTLIDDGKILVGKGVSKFQGVKAVLMGDASTESLLSKSDLAFMPWQSTDTAKLRTQVKFFRSEERSRALQLCGWGFERDGYSPSSLVDKLEADHEFERAAAIALFNLKILRAIQALNNGARSGGKGADSNLSVVAMALSGFTDDKNTLWKEMCGSLRTQLKNPYLRAMFAFLTTDTDNYEEVLKEHGVEVHDRVAFACTFLSDSKLVDYIQSLTNEMTEAGNLDGILLTGINKDGLELLQRYVDLTGDIQTAALTVIQALPNAELSKDPWVATWIEGYRTLLDSWKLWHQRAEFDVHHNACDSGSKPPQQVFVNCNFCGKGISSHLLAGGRHRQFLSFGGAPLNKTKLTSCPSCRKPLPRCSLCLINMGTASGSTRHKQKDKVEDSQEKMSLFSDWFTWCQGCRHGGHAEHITEWFRDHVECPVTACTCKCMGLDSVSKIVTDLQTTPSP